jgi:DNA-binding response OmpR family regulator
MEVEGVRYISALEVVYSDGQPSVSYYQLKRLLRAAAEQGVPLLFLTDHDDEVHRGAVVVYLGKAM